MPGFEIFASAVLLIFAAAIGKMWLAHLTELKECKENRDKLHVELTASSENITKLSMQIGRMEGHLEAIDKRHDKAFKSGGSEKIETKT